MSLISAGEAVDAALGKRLGREFLGDARRLADVAGVLWAGDPDLRPRSLFYLPPSYPGAFGLVSVPAGVQPDVLHGMLAVAVGLHLLASEGKVEGSQRPTAYLDGGLLQARPRHRAAQEFAHAFLRAGATSRSGGVARAREVATARVRAG